MTSTTLSAERELIKAAYEDESRRGEPQVRAAVEATIAALDRGEVRVAVRSERGSWHVEEWVKQAILLYFGQRDMETIEAPPFEWRDKIPLKRGLEAAGIRVVPHAIARYGSFLEPGVVMMPSYVNIGAYVGSGTMIDTWATVGSCAQIGRDVHLSGGVGIGGVLEPLQANPVIVEDGAFIGSRAILVEGVTIGTEAVIGAGVVITASTPIIDVTGEEPITLRGFVPSRSVVIPGAQPKAFAAGTYNVPCALIIGQRTESTDRKTSLNRALREHDVPV